MTRPQSLTPAQTQFVADSCAHIQSAAHDESVSAHELARTFELACTLLIASFDTGDVSPLAGLAFDNDLPLEELRRFHALLCRA